MKKRFSLVMALAAFIFTISLVVSPVGSVFAAIADGTYQVNYEMKEKSSDSTSIADGYFVKPAKLSVENGKNFITVTLTNSDYVRSLNGPNGATKVSENTANKTVTYKMQVGDLSQPVSMGMHIVLPEEVFPGGYDHEHTARGVFDVSGLPEAGDKAPSDNKNSNNKETSDNAVATPVENPPTGDDTPIALYVTLLIASVAIFTVYKFRVARN